MDPLQFGTFFVGMMGLGLAGLVYLTRQMNRLGDRIERVENRIGGLEQGQARLEGRVGSLEQEQAPAPETIS